MKKLFYVLLTIVLIHCWSLDAVAQSSDVTPSWAVQDLESQSKFNSRDMKDQDEPNMVPGYARQYGIDNAQTYAINELSSRIDKLEKELKELVQLIHQIQEKE